MKYMCNRIFLMPLSSSTPSYMGLMIIIIHTHQCGNSGMNFQESSKRPLTGVYILPQNWVFYKSLFGGVEFFMVRNANFGLHLVVFEQKIWVFIKWTQFFIKYAKNGSFFYKYEYRNKRKNIHPWIRDKPILILWRHKTIPLHYNVNHLNF